MSHNIEMRSYPENVDRKKVQAFWDDYASHEDWQEGCSGLGASIRWCESAGILSDYDAAEAYINAHDSGWYDQLAVRYYEPEDVKYTQKVKELRARCNELHQKWCAVQSELYAGTVTAEYITCRGCGSKLKRTLLRSNRCPVCNADMRPQYKVDAEQSAHDRWKAALSKLSEEEKKCEAKSKKKVCWLVKIEYHT